MESKPTVDKEAIKGWLINYCDGKFPGDFTVNEVVSILESYSSSLLKENEALKEEIAGLNRVISQMFADKVSETRELQSSNEKLKIERDKFEGGDELKSKKIIELEAWKESAMNIMSPMQEIGKAIGVKLGHSIHDKILPAIIVLKSSNEAKDREIAELKERVINLQCADMTHEYNNAEAERVWPQIKEQIEEPLKQEIERLKGLIEVAFKSDGSWDKFKTENNL